MKRALSIIPVMALLIGAVASGATYYSQGSLAPNALASWNTVRTGGGSAPADFVSGDIFVIQNGDSMATSATWTVGGSGSPSVWIEGGGKLTASHAFIVTFFHVADGGEYCHNFDAPGGGNGATSDFPGNAPFTTLEPASTVNIAKWATAAATAPAALPNITYGNLAIDVPAWAGTLDMGIPDSSAMTVSGDLAIMATGGGAHAFSITRNRHVTLNVGGSLVISGGTFSLTDGGIFTDYLLNIGGDLLFTGGTWAQEIGGTQVHFSGGVSPAVTATFNPSFPGISHIDWVIDSAKTVQLNSDFPVGSARSLQVFGRLDCGEHQVAGNGQFKLEPGATLGIGRHDGITTWPSTSGNINVIDRRFSRQASYVYSGALGSISHAGNGLPDTVRNLTIDRGSGIELSQSCAVTDTLRLENGTVYLGALDTLAVVGDVPLQITSGYVSGSLALHVPAGPATMNFPVSTGIQYSPVNISFNNVSSPGMLTVSVDSQTHPSVAIPGSTMRRFWRIDGDSLLAFDFCSPWFCYLDRDFNTSFSETGDEGTMVAGRFTCPYGPWNLPAVWQRYPGGTGDGGSIILDNVTAFGDFTFAKDGDAIADLVPPQLVLASPADGAVDVDRNSWVALVFTKPINWASFAFDCAGSNWEAHWSPSQDTVWLSHDPFMYGATVTFTVTRAHDFSGNALAAGAVPNPFSFTVIGDPDTPRIISTSPADGATGVFLNQPVTIVFSEAMDTSMLYLMCMPEPGGWNHSWSASMDTLVLYHNNFDPETSHTLMLAMMADLDGHTPLAGGPVPMPFSFTTGTSSGVAGRPAGRALPTDYVLAANRPNPVRGRTAIEYALPRAGRVQLSVYNMAGQKVRTLVDGTRAAGYHSADWDARDQTGRPLAAGIYLYRMRSDGFSATRNLVIIR